MAIPGPGGGAKDSTGGARDGGGPPAGAGPAAPGAVLPGLAGQEKGLLACIHCGFCLPACPTYRVLGDEADSPRGRLHLMRAVAEGRLEATDPDFQRHMDRCLGCRACEPVCPAGVPYGQLLEHAREEIRAHRRPGLLARGLLAVFGNRGLARMAGWAARLLRAAGLARALARLLPERPWLHGPRTGLAMLASSRPWAGLRQAPGGPAGGGMNAGPGGPEAGAAAPGVTDHCGERVGVLAGCVQQGLYARVGAATRRTLAANGYRLVAVGDTGCCGALHAHAGDLEGARAAARRQIRAFEEAGVERVAVDAAGCGAAMKGYGELLAHDGEWAERARVFSRRVRDVTELLAAAGPRRGAPVSLRVTYDPPCHLLHGQGIHDPVQRVLAAVPGLEAVPLPDGERCCGGAGIYGLTQPGLGGEIAGRKRDAVLSTGAEAVLTGNPGCMMQTGAGLLLAGAGRGVLHPVEVLDESYRRGGIHERRD